VGKHVTATVDGRTVEGTAIYFDAASQTLRIKSSTGQVSRVTQGDVVAIVDHGSDATVPAVTLCGATKARFDSIQRQRDESARQMKAQRWREKRAAQLREVLAQNARASARDPMVYLKALHPEQQQQQEQPGSELPEFPDDE
jgi:hypothetical protein